MIHRFCTDLNRLFAVEQTACRAGQMNAPLTRVDIEGVIVSASNH